MKEVPGVKPNWKLHLIAVTAIYVLDAFFFCQGMIALFVAGVYAACFGVTISTVLINNKIARSRAEMIVSLVKQYKAKYGHYPDKLQALVPEFLPSVPRAKYSFSFNEFMYSRLPGGHVVDGVSTVEVDAALSYVALPPFGRPTYYFE
jgi:hypothetical protein